MEEMSIEPKVLTLTEREVKEIKHATFYANECNHGTTGHNQLILIAKLAQHLGFILQENQQIPGGDTPWLSVVLPDAVAIDNGR